LPEESEAGVLVAEGLAGITGSGEEVSRLSGTGVDLTAEGVSEIEGIGSKVGVNAGVSFGCNAGAVACSCGVEAVAPVKTVKTNVATP